MAEPGSARSAVLLVLCAFACVIARAQPALQPSAAASAAERAQKETDRTMYWIRVLATTPAPVKTATAPKAVAAAALAPAKAAAETREKAKAVSAQAPATSTTAPSSGALAPTAVAHVSKPAQAPDGDASEPSALSTRGADIAAAAVANTESAPQPDVAPSPAPEPDPGLVQLKSVQPEFPIAVIERLRKGHVEVRFEVEPGGSVIDATVVQSSASRLNGAALDAVGQWRFKPTSAFHTALVDLVFNVDKSN